MPVPRRPERAVDQDAERPVNGIVDPAAAPPNDAENGALPAEAASQEPPAPGAMALPPPGRRIPADPGLYALLGLDPSASDAEIQTTYRRQAARLLGSGSDDVQAMKRLNVAYEVLGNPVRRAEYDRLRSTQYLSPHAPTPIRQGAKVATVVKRRRRPRQAVQPR